MRASKWLGERGGALGLVSVQKKEEEIASCAEGGGIHTNSTKLERERLERRKGKGAKSLIFTSFQGKRGRDLIRREKGGGEKEKGKSHFSTFSSIESREKEKAPFLGVFFFLKKIMFRL